MIKIQKSKEASKRILVTIETYPDWLFGVLEFARTLGINKDNVTVFERKSGKNNSIYYIKAKTKALYISEKENIKSRKGVRK